MVQVKRAARRYTDAPRGSDDRDTTILRLLSRLKTRKSRMTSSPTVRRATTMLDALPSPGTLRTPSGVLSMSSPVLSRRTQQWGAVLMHSFGRLLVGRCARALHAHTANTPVPGREVYGERASS